MKIFLACDHAAIDLKDTLCAYLAEKGHEVCDLGINVGEKADYPKQAKKLCKALLCQKDALGVLVCGTGVGMSICANKVKGIRAAVVSDAYSARMTRMHNNANVICMGARVVGDELAKLILDEFLNACFEGGRHAARVDMIGELEEEFGK